MLYSGQDNFVRNLSLITIHNYKYAVSGNRLAMEMELSGHFFTIAIGWLFYTYTRAHYGYLPYP